ncbi:MAG: SDR family oxidoreductase [Comamonadaceae bacterium]|nr:MAG: SDR family oxidoreductase [Comamonadaceae bacterium]
MKHRTGPAPRPRTALVTGAARGIGLAIAERLGADGMRVFLADIDPAVHDAARALRQQGAEAQARMGDIADEAWVRDTVQQILGLGTAIDVLVNNAGISPKTGGVKASVEQMQLHEWNRVMAVNLTGAFLLSREVIPAMRAQRWGRILNISSQGGRTRTRIAGAHYAASKAGLIGFTRTLAGELAPDAITVNSVAPGRVASDMARGATESANQRFLAGIPLGRVAEPAEIAACVAFLASDEAGYITGATLDVNGGSFMG